MSGYEQSPDYGGRKWRWFDYIWTIAVTVLIAFLFAECSRVASAQTNTLFYQLPIGATFSGIATVYDADTIRIDGQRVRLWGIDAPEIDQACENRSVGVMAAYALVRIADGRMTTCEVKMRPSHNRPVAMCTQNGVDLGGAIVDAGWGWDSEQFSHGQYAERETRARSRSFGLWTTQCEAPWAYRAMQRN